MRENAPMVKQKMRQKVRDCSLLQENVDDHIISRVAYGDRLYKTVVAEVHKPA